jgi:Domain of unknown function (DUF4398)
MSLQPLDSLWSRRWAETGSDPGTQHAHADARTTPGVGSGHSSDWASGSWSPRGYGRIGLYGATLVASALGACASMPSAPTPQMTRAESAIEQAQRAGAGELATEPLEAAERNLSAAKVAVTQHNNVAAGQLVDKAYADARLADYTAQSAKSAKAAAEVDQTIHTLEDEANRPRSP